ncbi:MAG: nucleotidyl transferase AbiEii/AbiGii toxin family protein, partial [Planctomycetota bacterium]
LEVLKIVAERLEGAGISYMISGSVAANYYTIPRMTRDIDVVIELEQGDVEAFIGLFESDFYLSREVIKNEVSRRGMFNLIHNRHVIKIDFIVKKSSAYQQSAFSRKKEVIIEQSPMWFVTAEDLVVSKLLWAKDSHSEIQLKDVANLMQTVDNLDLKYVNGWVRELRLEQIYSEATE